MNKEKKEYICDDTPVPMSERIAKMSKEEVENEFFQVFGKYLKEESLDND